MKTEMDSYENEEFETATKICNGNTWNNKRNKQNQETRKVGYKNRHTVLGTYFERIDQNK